MLAGCPVSTFGWPVNRASTVFGFPPSSTLISSLSRSLDAESPGLEALGVQQLHNIAGVTDAFAGGAVKNEPGASRAVRRFWSGSQPGFANYNVGAADFRGLYRALKQTGKKMLLTLTGVRSRGRGW